MKRTVKSVTFRLTPEAMCILKAISMYHDESISEACRRAVETAGRASTWQDMPRWQQCLELASRKTKGKVKHAVSS